MKWKIIFMKLLIQWSKGYIKADQSHMTIIVKF
jgi:hypothetical protein